MLPASGSPRHSLWVGADPTAAKKVAKLPSRCRGPLAERAEHRRHRGVDACIAYVRHRQTVTVLVPEDPLQ
jgi:hypothetical protein